ncbi:MAG TPA: hypothetical protein VJK30_02820 [Coxiellaceae bacterium]|nr:MAG: hypothetical protein A3E81_02820 [Gammaproteobacteria bacterium RIFCSPHIGHO2_12_FULL_36_30]HLB56248.1 hypothetical protein [Coxiellaceae bacterium]
MKQMNDKEFERILADPSASFKMPDEVLHDDRLSRRQKIAVLKLWAFDERELEVAEGENMRGHSGPIILDEVMLALRKIEDNKTSHN